MGFIHFTANLDLDPWTDITADKIPHNLPVLGGRQMADVERIGILPGGMSSGKASVAFLLRLPDGSALMAEISLAAFRMVAGAVEGAPVTQLENL